MRRTLTIVLAGAVALAVTPATNAAGKHKRPKHVKRACSAATIHSALHGGLTVGKLLKGDKMVVIKRQESSVYVVSARGQGWVPTGTPCR